MTEDVIENVIMKFLPVIQALILIVIMELKIVILK